MTIPSDETGFISAWEQWHDERVAAARAPYGLAAVTVTHWLGETPEPVPGTTGVWSVAQDRVVHGDADGGVRILAVGDVARLDGVEVRVLARADRIAVRVVDPTSARRTDLRDIDAYRPVSAWVRTGRFRAAAPGATIVVDHVDGAVTSDPVAGWVDVEVGGNTAALAAFPAANGALHISFGDATNGSETAPFRFLSLPAPGDDGQVVVDFNRAYLPPSTFTDHYLCPQPPQGNRLSVAIRAGEKTTVTRAVPVGVTASSG